MLYVCLGSCELTDYPEEGYSPRYWQYERTPLRQKFAKLKNSDQSEYERMVGWNLWNREKLYNMWAHLR